MIRLKLVPIGEVPEIFLRELQERLKRKGFFVYLDKIVDIPEEAYSPYRHQYKAELILDVLRNLQGIVFGLILDDIFSDKKSFDFSLSEYDGGGVISIHRLQPEFYKEKPNFDLTISRILKEVLHNLGHVKGLKDCENPECVLYTAKSVEDIDKKGEDFCKVCKTTLATMGVDL